MKHSFLIVFSFILCAASLSAQDDGMGEYDTYGDTTSIDSSLSYSEEGGDAGVNGPMRFEKHERFQAPYDSLRELIYYSNVVEDPNCNECTADSLYIRALRYFKGRFGEKTFKEITQEAKPGNKLTVLLKVPLVTKPQLNVVIKEGFVEYKLILRFQDNRFKYEFSNFVHIRDVQGAAGGQSRTYAEYYRMAKTYTRANDLYLIGMDMEVKQTVANLTKALREKWKPEDEDDW
jgi:hypothetical protein